MAKMDLLTRRRLIQTQPVIRTIILFLLVTGQATMSTLPLNRGSEHDFDFLGGSWNVHHHYLKHRLQGSNDWIDFDGKSEMKLLLNGFANLDRYWFTREGREVEGFALRQFNPESQEWTIYWADSLLPGILQPPVRGKFRGDVGEFIGEDEFKGQKILCRFIWRRRANSAPQWEQSFSTDRGKTWEANWVMTFTRKEDASGKP